MCKFSAKGTAFAIAPAEFLIRLVMYALPVATLLEHGIAMSAATALFFGLIDGTFRRGSYTSRSFLAGRDGLEITSGLSVQAVPWTSVSAIQAWHHFNRVDFLAVHYFSAGRVAVATCASRYAEAESRAFVRACAHYVSADVPRLNITLAGLGDQSVYRPLLRRLIQDVAVVAAIGAVLGAIGPGFALGLLAASLSALIAVLRHSVRSIQLVQRNGLWYRVDVETSPLRTIPRGLQLWVHCLAESTSSRQVAELEPSSPP